MYETNFVADSLNPFQSFMSLTIKYSYQKECKFHNNKKCRSLCVLKVTKTNNYILKLHALELDFQDIFVLTLGAATFLSRSPEMQELFL